MWRHDVAISRRELMLRPNVRGECSSFVAHLSAVADSRVRIPAPSKYWKALAVVSAASEEALAASAEAAVIYSSSEKYKRPKATKK